MERHLIVAIQDSSSTLYERVGGKSAVAAVVNLLYVRQTLKVPAPARSWSTAKTANCIDGVCRPTLCRNR
jgi:hypothetical protein